MKRIKLLLIATTALTLALPLAGCMHGDSGNADNKGVEQRIETQMDENGNCPDGECPRSDSKDGKCPDKDDCPDGNCDKLPENRDNNGCPDGKCPLRPLLPRGRHGVGRIAPLPRPHKGN